MNDVIVVLPGIMGSVLVDRHGREIWGVSAGTALQSITRLGRNFETIALPEGMAMRIQGTA